MQPSLEILRPSLHLLVPDFAERKKDWIVRFTFSKVKNSEGTRGINGEVRTLMKVECEERAEE